MKKPLFKYMVFMICIALLLPAFMMNTPVTGQSPAGQADSETLRVVADISNMTGVKVEEIIRLKGGGRTWNEVLDILKGYKEAGGRERDKRYSLLEQSGLGREFVFQLKEEGYTEDEILEAQWLVERVVFQLSEITRADNTAAGLSDTTPYSELSQKIDIGTAVYLMLKLKEHFGSMEAVLDEYLCALQIDVNLELHLIDRGAYLKEKEAMMPGLGNESIITMADIEERMLEKIRQDNTKDMDVTGFNTGREVLSESKDPQNPLPYVPVPKVEDVIPRNPAHDVMEEIKVINPN